MFIESLIKALEKAPELAGLVLIVWMFLRHQADTRKEFLANIQTLHEENVEARQSSRETIRENTMVSRETNTLLTGLTLAVKDLDRRMNGK